MNVWREMWGAREAHEAGIGRYSPAVLRGKVCVTPVMCRAPGGPNDTTVLPLLFPWYGKGLDVVSFVLDMICST